MKRVFVLFLLIPICAMSQTLEPFVVDSNMKRFLVGDVFFLNDNVGYISGGDTATSHPATHPPLTGMLYKTEDGGQSWHKIFEDDDLQGGVLWDLASYRTDSVISILYTGSSYDDLFISGNQNWQWQSLGVRSAYEILTIGENIIVVAGYDNRVLHSANSGTTWDTVFMSNLNTSLPTMTNFNDTVYLAYSEFNMTIDSINNDTTFFETDYILKTSDYGMHWDTLYENEGSGFKDIAVHENYIYTVTKDGLILFSNLAGNFWINPIDHPMLTGARLNRIIATQQGPVYIAADWERTNGVQHRVVRIDAGMTSFRTIYDSTIIANTGNVNDLLPYELNYSIEALPNGEIIIALPDNRFYRYTPEFVGISSPSVNNTISVYPNPASTQATIQWQQPLSGKLMLYNLQGELLQQQMLFNQNSHTLDISSLQTGMYLVTVQTEQGVHGTKLLVE